MWEISGNSLAIIKPIWAQIYDTICYSKKFSSLYQDFWFKSMHFQLTICCPLNGTLFNEQCTVKWNNNQVECKLWKLLAVNFNYKMYRQLNEGAISERRLYLSETCGNYSHGNNYHSEFVILSIDKWTVTVHTSVSNPRRPLQTWNLFSLFDPRCKTFLN